MALSGSRLTILFSCVLIVLSLFVSRQGAAQSKPAVIGSYVGAGSCNASNCHGDVEAHKGVHVKQTEYGTWTLRDPHARAYQSLESPLSLRMATILNTDKDKPPVKPVDDERCLACHALVTQKKVLNFSIKEGVTCEVCHGPASGWLGSHIRKDSTPESVRCGMTDLGRIEVRTRTCLECHLGKGTKEVTHTMIAAGHPDLLFQVEIYSANQPPHWRLQDDPRDPDVKQKDPSYGVRLWTIGQAIQLQEALGRLEDRAKRSLRPESDPSYIRWPEFSEYDCFSCHHPLSYPDKSWRQERDCTLIGHRKDEQGKDCSLVKSGGSWTNLDKSLDKPDNPVERDRIAGLPQWNTAHYSIFLLVAQEVDPDTTNRLRPLLSKIYTDTKAFKPAKAIQDDVENVKEGAARLVAAMTNAKFDDKQVLHLMDRISASADLISLEDTRSGEQAYMALDTLLRSYEKQSGPTGQKPDLSKLHAALTNIAHEFANPSTYSGPGFALAMHKFNVILHSNEPATASRPSGNRPSQGGIARKLQVGQAHAANR